MRPLQERLILKRGVVAAAIGAFAGITLPAVAMLVGACLCWLFQLYGFLEWGDVVFWWKMHSAPPLTCISIYLALAAWATYTPLRYHGLARTLLILLVVGLPASMALMKISPAPQRFKWSSHPYFYSPELLAILLPPLLVATLLIVIRSTSFRNTNHKMQAGPKQ